MKRKLLGSLMPKGLLAVPAAALMLGAAQAGTTIGLNFQAWYYDSGTTPQTIGFGQGYQTTGFPVTARAFGVNPGNWTNTDPLDCSSALDTTLPLGSLTVHLTAKNPWSGDIGNLVDPAHEWDAGYFSTVLPGNDEVTWGYEDNTGWTNTVSGLNTAFPNGYVIELIGAVKCTANSRVVATDGVNTSTNAFNVIYTAGNANFSGPAGLMGITNFTADSVTFGSVTRNISSAQSCGLAGFIISDQPVVTRILTNVVVNQGSTLNLNARVIGVGTLGYQWQHAGTNIPGATTVPFAKTAATDDAGNWVLIATNAYGTATSDTVAVTVNQVPLITTDLALTTNLIYTAFRPTLSVVAAGALPLSYQWRKNGANLSGETNASLTITNLAAGLAGYNVVVTNVYGTATSATNYLNAVAAADGYTTAVGQDTPATYWPLNESSGTTALDYAGASHDGTNTSATVGVAGPVPPTFPGFAAGKTGYQFDGASSYVTPGTKASLSGTTDFTVEAWVNTTSATGQAVVHQRSSSGFVGAYRVSINADGTVYFALYGSGGFQFNFSSTAKVANGQWHHIAAVRSGTSAFIYVDGALSASASGTVQAMDGTLPVYVGYNQRDNSEYFNGLMANVAIYNKALTAGQVITHYATATGTPLQLTLSQGGLIEDSKPAGTLHPGVNYGSTWNASITDTAGTPVTRNGVQAFTNNQIVIPPHTDFDSTTGTFTFWLQANAPLPGPGTEAAMLVDRRTTNGTVIVLSDAGNIKVQCSGVANTFEPVSYIPDNNWHHVAVTYDQSVTGAIEVFIDGVSVGSQVNTTNWAWPTAQQIELGKSHDGYWRLLNGQMDDFRIYNRILTAPEIASIKSSDALVDTAALTVRYNFGTAAGVGRSVSWPFGTLYSSPAMGTGAVWTPVSGATPPKYSFEPVGTLFFRAQY